MTPRTSILTLALTLAACGPDPAQKGDDPTSGTATPSSTSTPTPSTPPLFTTGTESELDAVYAASLDYLAAHLDPDRYGDPADYEERRVFVDGDAPAVAAVAPHLAHTHLRQVVDGVPVFGGEVIVHLHDDGAVRAITDRLVPDLGVDPVPTLTAGEAIDIAVSLVADPPVEPPALDPDNLLDDPALQLDTDPRAELYLVRRDGSDHLVWAVQLSRLQVPSLPRLFLDAHTGAEVFRYDNLHTTTTTADTTYDGVQTIEAFEDVGITTWILEDPVRDFLTLDWDDTNGSSLYRVVVASPGPFTDTSAGAVHWATQSTEDYYLGAHGRDGIDGLGGPGSPWSRYETGVSALTGSVRYGNCLPFSCPAANAFWDPTNTFFAAGDGDGSVFDPLVSVDIVAHEFTHGVTQFTADLIYENESGALNEAWSDIMGAAVERYVDGTVTSDTWLVGEDPYTPGTAGDALRYMDDPTLDGDGTCRTSFCTGAPPVGNPSFCSCDHYEYRYLGTADYGGVHFNSGIANLAFHLLSEGGDHPYYTTGSAVSGIGFDAAEAIFYRALASYMVASSGFHDAREATVLAAADLYGEPSVEVDAVDRAWEKVGVTPWSLLPSGFAASGVGHPSVVYRKPSGDMVMAFETRLGDPTADCPNGTWGIGLATSSDGRTFDYVDTAELLGPQGSTYHSCVVAHPTIMLDDAGTGLHLWFKAEQDLTTCGGDPNCIYSGIGYAHVASDLVTVDTLSAAPVIPGTGPMGYPSVVRSDGTFTMAFQDHPHLYTATASAADGPWTISGAPILSPGDTSFAVDEVFSPALICEGDTFLPPDPWTMYFGGRNRGGGWGTVLDGGIGHADSADFTSWSVDGFPTFLWTGAERWRHWTALRHGSDPIFWYSETVGGTNRIGLRATTVDWSLAGLASRTCTEPGFW